MAFIHKPRTKQAWFSASLHSVAGSDKVEVGFGVIVEHEKTMTESRFFRFAWAELTEESRMDAYGLTIEQVGAELTEESLMDAYGLTIEQVGAELERIGFGQKSVENYKRDMKKAALYRVFWACESSQDTAIYAA